MNPIHAGATPPLPHAYPRAGKYAGLAADQLFQALRAFDDRFLAANRDALRDYQAHWVADPLHHWSRRWEYPYVYEQLLEFDEGIRGRPAVSLGGRAAGPGRPGADTGAGFAAGAGTARPGAGADGGAIRPDAGAGPPAQAGSSGRVRILDAGSGLTFFPHFVAEELGAEVECCDRDPAMERDARRLRPPASAAVRYSTQDLARLTFADESFDATYCISVLEHTAERERIVDEFYRTLRPGGLLVVTIDVSLDGRAEIPREDAASLIATLRRRFRPLADFAAAVGEPGPDVVTTRNVGEYAPELTPPRTYASAGGVLRRLLRPHTFPWRSAFRRLFGGGGGAVSELTFFCTAWVKPTERAPERSQAVGVPEPSGGGA